MPNPWLPRYGDPAVRYGTGWTWPTAEEIAAALSTPNRASHSMKRQRYYPSRIAEQIPWLENFRSKLPDYASTLGLVQAEVDAIVLTCRFVIYALAQWLAAVRAFGPACTEAIDILLSGTGGSAVELPAFAAPALPAGVAAVPPGALTRIFDFVQKKIKDANGYTEVIGLDLRVIAPEDAAEHAAPAFKAQVEQGTSCQCVRLNFFKYGHEAVWIEGRRGGAAGFLAVDSESPYLDDRPLLAATQPEIRGYRMRFWDKGTPNGEWTDWTDVNVGP